MSFGGAFSGKWVGGQATKPAPWWYVAGATCAAAYRAIGATSAAASKVNLANPGTNDLSAVPYGTEPGWSAAFGWYRVGENAAWNTGVVATSEWTFLVRFSSAMPNYANVLGVENNEGGGNHYPMLMFTPTWDYLGSFVRFTNSYARYEVEPHVVSGVIGMAGDRAFVDGELVASGHESYTVMDYAPYPIYLFTWNDRNQMLLHNPAFGGNILALTFYTTRLTDAQVKAVSTAMAALE